MSEVQKGFRMPSELSEAAERLAKTRGISFSALVLEALEDKVSGKSSSPGVVSEEIAGLVEALKVERLNHTELSKTLVSLHEVLRVALEDRVRTSWDIAKASEELGKAKEQLEAMTQLVVTS